MPQDNGAVCRRRGEAAIPRRHRDRDDGALLRLELVRAHHAAFFVGTDRCAEPTADATVFGAGDVQLPEHPFECGDLPVADRRVVCEQRLGATFPMEDVATIRCQDDVAVATDPRRGDRLPVCPQNGPVLGPLSVLVPMRNLVVADDTGHEEAAVLLDM